MSRRAPLYGFLSSEAVSLTGTRVSMIAVPWLVLTTTGSASKTGLAAFAEMLPYVLTKALTGPLVDRVGPRRICIGADLVSVGVVGAIPLLHRAGLLGFPVLLTLVACAGLVRGPGDGARQAMVPSVVAAAEVPLERLTGLAGAVERLASTVGAAFAGVLVALVGPAPAVALDALSFGVSAALLATTAPRRDRRTGARRGRYVEELYEGWRFLRGDAVLVAMVSMVAVTNLLDAAYASVLVPVWARESGAGASGIGLLFAFFSAAAVLGSVCASAFATRLPRFLTYVVGFTLAGFPRFLMLALDLPVPVVVGAGVVFGFGCGFVNPILGAVMFERIPEELVGRVTALNSALCWVGIPFGGILGGVLVGALGLTPALLLVGGVYLAATLAPVLNPAWRRLDDRRRPLVSECSLT